MLSAPASIPTNITVGTLTSLLAPRLPGNHRHRRTTPADPLAAGGALSLVVGFGRRSDHVPAVVGYWDLDLRNRVANGAYLDWFGKRGWLGRGLAR